MAGQVLVAVWLVLMCWPGWYGFGDSVGALEPSQQVVGPCMAGQPDSKCYVVTVHQLISTVCLRAPFSPQAHVLCAVPGPGVGSVHYAACTWLAAGSCCGLGWCLACVCASWEWLWSVEL
jgi:hypothetical protein